MGEFFLSCDAHTRARHGNPSVAARGWNPQGPQEAEKRRRSNLLLYSTTLCDIESILGDVSGLEIQAAINLAKERVEWNKNRPFRRC